jgi:hypothetical protein
MTSATTLAAETAAGRTHVPLPPRDVQIHIDVFIPNTKRAMMLAFYYLYRRHPAIPADAPKRHRRKDVWFHLWGDHAAGIVFVRQIRDAPPLEQPPMWSTPACGTRSSFAIRQPGRSHA